MKTAKEYSDTAKREVSVDVDALLAAINEISESEVHRSQEDPERVSVDGREYHTWHELAEAFELDIHDFSVTEVTVKNGRKKSRPYGSGSNLLMQEALENSLHQEI